MNSLKLINNVCCKYNTLFKTSLNINNQKSEQDLDATCFNALWREREREREREKGKCFLLLKSTQ